MSEIKRKQFVSTTRATGDGRIEVIASTESPDREGDVISADGWQLDAYMKNPVVLWAHDYRQPPIGKCVSIAVTRGELRAVTEPLPLGMNPFADQIWAMVRAGALNSVSVGFRPLKFVFNAARGGVDFQEQELLEYSIVPVPANADCLVVARSAGLSEDQVRRLFIDSATRDLDRHILTLDDEETDLGLSPALVKAAVHDAVHGLVTQELKRMLARDDVDVSPDDVRAAMQAVVPTMVSAHITAAIRLAQGRLD